MAIAEVSFYIAALFFIFKFLNAESTRLKFWIFLARIHLSLIFYILEAILLVIIVKMSPIFVKFFDETMFSPAVLMTGIVIGFIYYKRLDSLYRILHLFLIVAFTIDLLSRIIGEVFGNNLIFIPVFGLLELLLFAHIYLNYLMKAQEVIWLFLLGLLVCYNLYEIILFFNIEPKAFNSQVRVYDSLFIVVLSIAFYIKQIALEATAKPGFLQLNTIIFAFYSLNLILYLPINFLINETSDIKFLFWNVSLVFTVIFYALLVRMIWKHGRNPKP